MLKKSELKIRPSTRKARQKKYSIAEMVTEKGATTQTGADSVEELQNIINSSSSSCWFESINTILRKIYIDIDFNDKETKTKYKYIPIEDFDNFINNLIDTINKEIHFLQKSDQKADDNHQLIPIPIIQYATKEIKGVVVVSSIHIIYKNILMTYQQQKEFIQYLNNKHALKLDKNIYKRNQLFRLQGQTKFNKKNVLEFYKDDFSFSDCFISYLDDKENIIIQYDISKADDFKSQQNQEDKKQNQEDKKQGLKSDDDNFLKNHYYNDFNDILDNTIKDLSNDFFNNSNDWKIGTRILKKLLLCNVDEWATISSDKSDDINHTKDANLKYILNVDVTKTRGGYKYLTSIFNKYLAYNLVYNSDVINNDFYLFVDVMDTQKILNIQDVKTSFIQQTKTFIEIGSSKIKRIYKYNNIHYNASNGYLQIQGEPITNYFLNGLLHHKTNNYYYDNNVYDFTYDKIDNEELKNICKDFITNPNINILSICAFMGSGKTHFILKDLLQRASNNFKMGIVSPNNTLNIEVTTKFNDYNFNEWRSHLNDDYEGYNLICSLESIYKMDKMEYIDILIIDEFETVLNHFESNTENLNDGSKYYTYKKFISVITKSKKIIVLDANISNDRLKWLENVRNMKALSVNISQNNFRQYKHNIFNERSNFFNHLEESIKQNKKISICSNSKNQTEQINLMLLDNENVINKTILLINGSKIEITKPRGKNTVTTILKLYNEKQKKKFYEAIEENIIKYNIDIFVYSPTITTGISINAEIFNIQYCLFSKYSLCMREMLQMVYRNRQLKDKEINFFFTQQPITPIKQRLIKDLRKFYTLPIKEQIKNIPLNDYQVYRISENENYYNMRIVNKREDLETKNNIIQAFYKLLVIDNNININYVYTDTKNKEDTTEIKEQLKDIEYKKYVDTKLITLDEYQLLYTRHKNKNKKEDLDDLTDEEYNQYSKFNKIVKYILYDNNTLKCVSYGYYTYKEAVKFENIINGRYWYDIYYLNNDLYKNINLYTRHNKEYNKYDLIYLDDIKQANKEKITDGDKENLRKDLIEYGADKMKEQYKNNLIFDILDYIIDVFNIDLSGVKTITNKDFENIINTDDKLNEYLTTYNKISFIDNKDYERTIKDKYKTIKSILKTINFNIHYVNKNNTNDNDKLSIHQMTNKEHFKFNNEPIINKPYTKFKIENENIIFDYIKSNTTKAIMKHKKDKMTFKTYHKEDIKQIKRGIYSPNGIRLFIYNQHTYKEYQANYKKCIIRNKIFEKNSVYKYMDCIDEITKQNKINEGKDDIKDIDIIKNVLDEIIFKIEIEGVKQEHKKQINEDLLSEIHKELLIKNPINTFMNREQETLLLNDDSDEEDNKDEDGEDNEEQIIIKEMSKNIVSDIINYCVINHKS